MNASSEAKLRQVNNGIEVPGDDVQNADSNFDVLPGVDAEYPQVQATDLYFVGALFLLALLIER